MATVLLLRHGRTASNATGTLAGRAPVELDEVGLSQARAVGERLAGVRLAAVVSSPVARCLQTLSVALPGTQPLVDEGLAEVGYGEWEGQPLKVLAKDPLWRVVQQHPSAVVFPGGEAMAAMAARAVAAVRAHDAAVTREHGDGALWLACSHGDVIKAVVADALGLHLDQFQRIVVDPGSVTVVRYTPARPFVVRLNDSAAAISTLVPPVKGKRRASSDAAVGGGSGAFGPPRGRRSPAAPAAGSGEPG